MVTFTEEIPNGKIHFLCSVICCFQRHQTIDLKIKIHILVIYVKSLKNSFEKVNYSVKFEIMGGGGEIITGREWLQVVGAKLCWSWVVWVVVVKLWLVGDGRC